MARIDRVRENYEQITEKLFSDKAAFAEYLKFAGKFFKLPSAQSMTIYGVNPNAVMVADYDTWQKFGRQVKRGTTSIAVFNNAGGLRHLFDVSQTAGAKMPYQWKLDKDTAAELLDEVNEDEGQRFQSLSGCINYLGAEKAREDISGVIKSLNISDDDRAAFEKSFISMTQYFIAARCEMNSSFKYNGSVDLSALDMLHSKAEKEKLCECVQLSGKSVLLSLERSINNIVLQGRTNDYGRNQTNLVRPERLVRGGQEVLSRNHNEERQNVQARPENVRISGANGAGTDGRGTGSDEREYRNVRREVAEVYDGELSRGDTVSARSAEMGADTQTDRQRSVGISGASAETVREREPAPENVRGNSAVGEHSGNDSRQGDNGGHSSSVPRVSNKGEKNPGYDTSNNDRAEENSPAFTLSDDQKYVAARAGKLLGHEIEKAVFDKIYSGVYAYAYDAKTPIKNIPDDELNNVISEITGENIKPEIPADMDKFYVDRENEIVRMVYYNPDSTAGGQLVYNEFDFDDIAAALATEDPMDYLYEHCKQTLLDVDMEGFDEAARDFLTDTEDFNSRDEHYLDKLFALAEPTYSILQLKSGDELHDYRFAGLEELRKYGLYVDRENYNKVYGGRLKVNETLDDIYDKFNINRPDDFKGHSLSVGDIIEIRQNGQRTANYVDDFGFEEIPDFYLSLEERKANENHERKTAQDRSAVDEIISALRNGKYARITEKSVNEQMITNARERKFSNITLQYDENGFTLRADTNTVKGAIITAFGQNEQAVRDYLTKNAENIELDEKIQESTIHFGLLGYGVTVYDTSKTDEQTHDYPIIAHISAEGIINYRVDKNSLNGADISRIENQAATVKQDFIERWNRLSVGTRYGRIVDAAGALTGSQSPMIIWARATGSRLQALKQNLPQTWRRYKL